MLNLFQHLKRQVTIMLMTCTVGSRNKFGMTVIFILLYKSTKTYEVLKTS
jgi:hypothetical protein